MTEDIAREDAEIAWIDLETTGLDSREGHWVLQIAIILTNGKFEEISTIERKLFYAPDFIFHLREISDEYVDNMHSSTGLWDQLSDPSNPNLQQLDELLFDWLVSYQPEPFRLLFGGNSIFLDREFMREFLPKTYAHLSYRSVDMTSVEKFFGFTENRPEYTKKLTHNALDDIRESIDQAKYHRDFPRSK